MIKRKTSAGLCPACGQDVHDDHDAYDYEGVLIHSECVTLWSVRKKLTKLKDDCVECVKDLFNIETKKEE